jgi:mannitol operon transcriptional antiterminator
MDLKERQVGILKILLREDSPMVVQDLADQLQVSIRTIRYDLKEMNYWLKEVGAEILSKPRVGVWIEKKEAARRLISESPDQNYRNFSSKARRMLVVMQLFIADEFITTEYLAEEVSVSRSTIVSTLKELKEEAIRGRVELISRARYGYRLQGKESDKRIFAARYLAESLKDQTYGEVREILPFNDVDPLFREIRKRISMTKKEYAIWIPQEQFQLIASFIFLSIQSMKRSRYVCVTEREKNSKNQSLQFMAKEILTGLSSWLDLEVPIQEVHILERVLLKNNCTVFEIKGRRVFDPKLIDAVYEMLRIASFELTLEDEALLHLKEELLLHLELTLEKSQLQIESKNYLLDEIRDQYETLYALAKKMAKVFEEYFQIPLNEDEVGFLTMYLCENTEKRKEGDSRKILIVCSSGKGAAKLLEKRIRNNLPHIEIVGPTSAFEAEENLLQFGVLDFVVSTVHLEITIPYLLVSPVISNEELGMIHSHLYGFQSLKETKRSVAGDRVRKQLASQQGQKEIPGIQRDGLEDYAHLTGMAVVEFGEMIMKLADEEGITLERQNLWGLTLHIILSIPRWIYGDYVSEGDLDRYQSQYPTMYKKVENTLFRIGQTYDLVIPSDEVVAVMRYIV